MSLILFLCLILSLLNLCVAELGYQCTKDDSSNNPQIALIEDSEVSDHQDILNREFHSLCSDYYDIKFVSVAVSENNNVIHFAVPGYYDGKPLNNYVYAGNISKADNAVCTKTNKSQPEFDCNEIVNLVSKSLLELNDGHIYDFVQAMDLREYGTIDVTHRGSCEPLFRNTSDLTTVLLCLRGAGSHKELNIQPLHLIQMSHYRCRHFFNEKGMRPDLNLSKNRLLAVLAPEPLEVPSEFSIPTIFYETPYLFSENKTSFPNSMNLLPWRLLKYGFLKFIQTVGWQRVAIVTDDSEYSLDFEVELTALFNKEKIVYTAIRCEDANCKMDKIVQELNTVPAMIVIANVEEKNVPFLIRNSHNQITWLVRDMVGERYDQDLAKDRIAFSFSLSIDTFTKGCDVEDNILTGLSSIAQAYKNLAEKDYNVNKHEFYRRFAKKAKAVTPRITEATVVVHKLYTIEVISTMSVDAKGAKLTSFNNPFTSGKQLDGTSRCLVTSYDYHKPCEDHLVMFLMFTLMLFMLIFLLITCYFDKTSPYNDIRYQHF